MGKDRRVAAARGRPPVEPTMDAAMIRTQLNGLGANLLGTATILGRTNMTCN